MAVRVIESTRIRIVVRIDTTNADVAVRDGPSGATVWLRDGVPGGAIGGPDLPQLSFEIALPPGTSAGAIEIARTGDPVIVREKVFVRPIQRPAPGSCRHTDTRFKDDGLVRPWPTPKPVPPDPELYRRAYAEQQPAAEIGALDHQGPNTIARIVARPLSLRRDGALQLEMHFDVVISLVPLADSDRARARPLRFHSSQQAWRWSEIATSRVINPIDIAKLGDYLGFLSHADYLIITSNLQWDDKAIAPKGFGVGDLVGQFERLAAWKRQKGLSARVVSIDDIVAGRYGKFTGDCRRDLQEVLREFIKWAYGAWGVTWLLLGGDSTVIPVRKIVGYAGGFGQGTIDPPDDGGLFWTGTFLKLHTSATIHDLIRTSDGRRLRYSAAGAGATPRWSYCVDETYAMRTAMATQYVRIDGSAAELQTEEIFVLNDDNEIPTDLYYATVAGYGASGADPLHFCDARTGRLGSRCTTRDWDWQNNGLYAQYNNGGDLGGQTYTADISVGRALVGNVSAAKAFVDKVIAYESAGAFSGPWISKLLVVSSNWGGRTAIYAADPLADGTYRHTAGADHTVIQLGASPTSDQKLIAVAADGSENALAFRTDASSSRPGWTYVASATDMTPSILTIPLPWQLISIPWPSRWIAVYGSAAQLAPPAYTLDGAEADGSMTDQEALRQQLNTIVPAWSNVDRLYEDDVDLDAASRAAAPLAHLTAAALEARLSAGPHIVSLSGHGNWPGCCTLSPDMTSRLTNSGRPFIVYADSCLTNEFDLNYAVSQNLVSKENGGGVAYIGNSRFSWISVGDDFQRNFFAGIPATTTIGLLHDRRCANPSLLSAFQRYAYWTIFSLNLVGDPEMRIRTHALYLPCIDFVASARIDQPYIVHVSNGDAPLARAVVTASSGEWRTQAMTDHRGHAALDLRDAPVGTLALTVTHPESERVSVSARVIGPAWHDAEIVEVNAGHAGAGIRARWDDVERIVDISPCAHGSILPLATAALTSKRRLRLYVADETSGQVIEAASMT